MNQVSDVAPGPLVYNPNIKVGKKKKKRKKKRKPVIV
jgi:hypothetical protein